MRSSFSTILLLVSALTAAAQHGGGRFPVSGASGISSPFHQNAAFPRQNAAFPPRSGATFQGSGMGARLPRGPEWRAGACTLSGPCNSAPRFWRSGNFGAPYPLLILGWNGWPTIGWNGWPAFGEYGFNSAFGPDYAGGQELVPYAPPTYLQFPAPAPVVAPEPIRATTAPVSAQSPTAPVPAQSSTDDTSELRPHQTPSLPPDASDEHPPLIALKNRWAYTALKYWTTGKTFHFITTQGDHMQVPTTMVDRVYPTPKPTQGAMNKAVSPRESSMAGR